MQMFPPKKFRQNTDIEKNHFTPFAAATGSRRQSQKPATTTVSFST